MKSVITLLCLLSLTGCSILETDAIRYQHQNKQWDTPTLYTTADVRVITKRHSPTLNTDVVCTEPTPDVAKALSTALNATASLKEQQTTATAGLSGGSAEAVAELAGRSTALLALRDSLFRSCEAYANGAIGSNAYSLILARYGQLMTALFLGEDIRGSVRAAAATVSSPSISGTGATPAGNNPPADSSGTAQKGTQTDKKSTVASGSASGASSPGVAGGGGTSGSSDTQGSSASGQLAASGGGSGAGGSGGLARATSAVAAVTLGRINEDYYDLDLNPVHLLIVACINEFDPTRLRPQGGEQGQNAWLRGLCNSAGSVQQLTDLQAHFVEQRKELERPAPALDPTVVWTSVRKPASPTATPLQPLIGSTLTPPSASGPAPVSTSATPRSSGH
jgi:hypothetical protein